MPDIKCPSCSRGLRISTDKTVIVTCPSSAGGCGTKFKYPFIERSSIEFRCACDGSHFTVGFQRKTGAAKFTVETITPVTAGGEGGVVGDRDSYNADVYDFDNFYCGCCGYLPDTLSRSFVRCGKCRQLVCGSQMYEKLDSATTSALWFVCYPECGMDGPITGRIEEYDASRSQSVERVASALLAGKSSPLRIK